MTLSRLVLSAFAYVLICVSSLAQQANPAGESFHIPQQSHPETVRLDRTTDPGAAMTIPDAAKARISSVMGRDEAAYRARAEANGFRMKNSPGLAADFHRNSVEFRARASQVAMSLTGYGYADRLRTPVPAAPQARNNRVEYRRGDLTEWYVNGPFGLEQGFTIERAPGKATGHSLHLDLAVGGDLTATLDAGGRSAILKKDGADVLRYGGLSVTDASGRELGGHMEVAGNRLSLVVDDAGAKYPVTIDPILQLAVLTASDGSSGFQVGLRTAISADGNTIIVGAPEPNLGHGAVYVFQKPAGGWATATQTAKLTTLLSSEDFGYAVGISGDGSAIAVGAPFFDSLTTSTGKAYLYVRPAGGWTSTTETEQLLDPTIVEGDEFGYSIAISGDGKTVVVGALQQGRTSLSSAGKASVYFSPTGDWTTMTELLTHFTSPSPRALGLFGVSTAINSDGSTIVIGAPAENAAYAFIEGPDGWGGAYDISKLTATDSAASDLFGVSVGISDDANTIVVGTSPSQFPTVLDKGAAYVFVKPAGGWGFSESQTAKLTSSDEVIGDGFGSSLSITGDGKKVIAGAYNATIESNSGQGAGYLFVEPSGGWTSATENSKFTAADGAAGDGFGSALSASGDGLTIVSGAPARSAIGAAYVFSGGGDASLSPNNLNFSYQAVGTTSATQQVTLTNSGGQSLNVSGVSVTGAFTTTQNCLTASPLAPGASCSENLAFAPTAIAPFTGTLTFIDDSGGNSGSTQTVALSGIGGTPPSAMVSPSSLTFPGQAVNTNSSGMTVTVTNNGQNPLHITAVTASSPTAVFQTTTNCVTASPIASGGSCTETVNFAPNASGPATGTLTFSDDSGGGAGTSTTQTVSLSGSGTVPTASLTPVSLAFGSIIQGSKSTTQQVTVTNIGSAPLHITAVAITPPPLAANFSTTTTCIAVSPLAPGGTCSENVAFTPTTSGSLSASFTVTDDSGGTAGTTQSINLSGMGVQPPHASLLQISFAFASQLIGTTSAAQSFTLVNTGGSPLHVTSVTASPGFTTTQNCVTQSPIAVGVAGCTESVSFAPTAAGPITGTITFTDDSDGSTGATQTISVSGTGLTPATASLSPLTLSFGNQAVGTSSTSQTVTVTNTGGSNLIVSSVVASPGFTTTQNCVAHGPIATNGTCTESIGFAPGSAGQFNGTITFSDNSGNTPTGATQTVSVSGSGVAPTASVAPGSVNFGSVLVNTASSPQTVTLTNTGGATLHVQSLQVQGAFTSTHNCTSLNTIAPGGSCSETVTFNPNAKGPSSGSLVFTDDSSSGPTQTVTLSGNGAMPVGAVTPPTLNFGTVTVGTTSNAMTITLTSSGGVPLHVSTVTAPGGFSVTHNCVAQSPIASSGSCSEQVTFTPTSSAQYSGAVVFSDDSSSGSQTVTVSGTGATGVASPSTGSLSFGSIAVGTASMGQTITLNNTGAAALHVSSVATSANFSSTHNCVTLSPIPAGGSCSETVSFLPSSVASFTGTFVFIDDSNGNVGATQLVSLSGAGIKASTTAMVSASPASALTGQPITFTYSVAGPAGDSIPPSGVVTVTASTGESCAGAAPSGSCSIAFTTGGTRTLFASYTGDSNFLSSTSGTTSVSITSPTADLFVTQQPSVTSVKAGANISYTLSVKNLGPYAANSVVISDPVPANSTFVSLNAGAPCSAPPPGGVGTVSCNWASLANGASATVTLTVMVGGSTNKTTISNTVSATAATSDPNAANNIATVATQITSNKK